MRAKIIITRTDATNEEWLKELTDRLDELSGKFEYDVVDGSETTETLPQRRNELIQSIEDDIDYVLLMDPDDQVVTNQFEWVYEVLNVSRPVGVYLREAMWDGGDIPILGTCCCKAFIRTDAAKDVAATTLGEGTELIEYIRTIDERSKLRRTPRTAYLWRQHPNQLHRTYVQAPTHNRKERTR